MQQKSIINNLICEIKSIIQGEVQLNTIDYIYNDIFLKELFPEGLNQNVYLGQIVLGVSGRLEIAIHTKQRPAKEIEKWGVWGKDYNVIVIYLSGTSLGVLQLENWEKVDYGFLSISHDQVANGQIPHIFTLLHIGEDWSIKIQSQGFGFGRCSTYFDNGKYVP